MEPSGHCPYLGLKQNRAIRFASPTPEHRCYVSGEAIDIPVDQSNYCLSQNHVHCPLYTGSMLPSTGTPPQAVDLPVLVAPTRGMGGWLATLSPRDRVIYALMVGLLSLIAMLYLFLGLQSLLRPAQASQVPSPQPTAALAVAATAVATAGPTSDPATPSPLPTTAPTPQSTLEPTAVNVIILPTNVPAGATNVPASPTAAATAMPTSPTAAATRVPATAQPSTAVPSLPSAKPAPTRAPTGAATVLLTAVPTRIPAATAAPTEPPVSKSEQLLTLYFGDATGALYVPVTRRVQVENNEVVAAAVRELIAGPQRGLTALLLQSVKLLGVQVNDGTAIVNFDRSPTSPGDLQGYYAVVYTLTQFANIRQVQFQINGQNFGIKGSGPVVRPVLNPLNPDGLTENTSASEFLPLYFPLNNGLRDVRIIRVVPKTKDTARATLNALLAGPGAYSTAVQRVIPEGTQVRGVALDQNSRVLTVDFTKEFTDAANRQAAVRNIVQSLTTLPSIRGVQILVENQPLADFWGEEYRNGFGKPQINPE